jgi:hypothetical protein
MTATLERRMLAVEPDLVLMAIVADDFDLQRTPGVDAAGYLQTTRVSRLPPAVSRLVRPIRLSYLVRDAASAVLLAGPDVVPALRRGELPASYAYVRRFARLADASGTPAIVVLLPASLPGALARVARQLQSDGIPFVDLSPLTAEFTPEQFRASRFDGHPSAAVHRRVGEELAVRIRAGADLGRPAGQPAKNRSSASRVSPGASSARK